MKSLRNSPAPPNNSQGNQDLEEAKKRSAREVKDELRSKWHGELPPGNSQWPAPAKYRTPDLILSSASPQSMDSDHCPCRWETCGPERKELIQLAALGANSALAIPHKGQTPRRERTKARPGGTTQVSVPPCVFVKELGCPQQVWLKIGPKSQEVPLSERCQVLLFS